MSANNTKLHSNGTKKKEKEKKLLVHINENPFFSGWTFFFRSSFSYVCLCVRAILARTSDSFLFSQFFTLHLSFDVITLLKCSTNQPAQPLHLPFVYYLDREKEKKWITTQIAHVKVFFLSFVGAYGIFRVFF